MAAIPVVLQLLLKDDQLKRGLATAEAGVSKLAGALGIAGAAIAGAFAVKNIINASIQQQDALNKVAFALKRTGEFTKAALKDMDDFSASLQKTTGVADDQVLGLVALAKNYGLSAAQSKEATKAAIDLAAATGTDLETAIEQVSAAYNGNIGKLAKLNPELKNLTKEQLAAGAATKILADQFGGSAAASLGTFSGALKSSQNSFGDLLESIGDVIVKNPAMIELIKFAGTAFEKFGGFINDNSETIRGFITGAVSILITVLGKILTGLSYLFEPLKLIIRLVGFLNIGFLKLAQAGAQLEIIRIITGSITSTLVTMGQTIVEVLSSLLKLPFAQKAFSALGVDASALTLTLDGMAISAKELADEITGEELAGGLGALIAAAEAGQGAILKTFDTVQSGAAAAGKTLEGLADKIGAVPSSKTVAIELKEDVQVEVAANSLFDDIREGLKGFGTIGLAAAGEAATALTQGAEGARKLVAKAGAMAADAIIPGAGAIAGPLIDALAQGPEAVKGMVNGFADGLLTLAENIPEAIGPLIEALAERAPDIIKRLVQAVPAIVTAIVDNIPTIIRSLIEVLPILFFEMVKLMPMIAVAIGGVLFDALKKAGDDFVKTIGEIGPKLFDQIVKIFEPLLKLDETIRNAVLGAFEKAGEAIVDTIKSLGGKGGGKGIIAETGGKIASGGKKILGLASGALVTGPGARDSVPALLAPGELVVDRTTGPRLNAFIDQFAASQGQPVQQDDGLTQALLLQVIQLLQKPMTVSAKTELDGRAFADVLLTLSRTNARTGF